MIKEYANPPCACESTHEGTMSRLCGTTGVKPFSSVGSYLQVSTAERRAAILRYFPCVLPVVRSGGGDFFWGGSYE